MILSFENTFWQSSKSVFGWGNLKFYRILNSKNFKCFNLNSFFYKILCLDTTSLFKKTSKRTKTVTASRCDLFQFHDDTIVFLLSFALAILLFKPFLLLLLPCSLSPSAIRNHSLCCALRCRPFRANPCSSHRRPHCSRAGFRRVLHCATIAGPLRNLHKLIGFFINTN